MNKNKFNYFVIFCIFFYVGIITYNNFFSSTINNLTNLDLFFMNLYPLMNIFYMKIINIFFFIFTLFLLYNILKEKWYIFSLLLLLNPLVYYVLTSVNLLFFELSIILFALFLLITNKKFSFYTFILLLLLFKIDLVLYVILAVAIY